MNLRNRCTFALIRGGWAVARAVAKTAAALLICVFLAGPAGAVEYTGITRDTFPVFNDPSMLSPAQAEAARLIIPRSASIPLTFPGVCANARLGQWISLACGG